MHDVSHSWRRRKVSCLCCFWSQFIYRCRVIIINMLVAGTFAFYVWLRLVRLAFRFNSHVRLAFDFGSWVWSATSTSTFVSWVRDRYQCIHQSEFLHMHAANIIINICMYQTPNFTFTKPRFYILETQIIKIQIIKTQIIDQTVKELFQKSGFGFFQNPDLDFKIRIWVLKNYEFGF